MKLKSILLLVFLVITILTITYIEYGVTNFGLSFYAGKDGGYLKRFESMVCLSTIYYILQLIRPGRTFSEYLLAALIGFFMAIIIGIACYLLLPADDGLLFHILGIVLSYLSFYVIKRLQRMTKNKATKSKNNFG